MLSAAFCWCCISYDKKLWLLNKKVIKYEFFPYLWYNSLNKKGEVFYAN